MLDQINPETTLLEISKILQNDPNPQSRSLAAQKLGEMGDESVVPILCQSAINDPIAEVRANAIQALGKLGHSFDKKEAWLWHNSEALEMIRKGIQQAAAGEVYDLGSFAEYADLEIDD
ncbi:MAG: HEAT repeat domain-containing protein [Brasilonema sp.]